MATQKKLTNVEIASFCSQAAMFFDAGLSPDSGMDIMLQDTQSESGQRIIEQIRDTCASGESFYSAVEQTGVFPDYVINMIHLGEESGNLDVTMHALSDYYERQEYISESIRNAVTYPLIMIFMMILIIIVLITKVLPIFNEVFEQLGTQMNSFSSGLMKMGQRLSSSSAVIIVVLLVAAILYFFFSRTSFGKRNLKKFTYKFPPTRKFHDAVACSRFASGISMTMKAGMDTYTSLDLVSVLTDDIQMSSKIDICKAALENGASFPDALSEAHIFSKLYSRMLTVGFTTGSQDTVLDMIADSYDREVDKRIHNIISILEPTLVIVLSLVVGMILLSVILPLMGIMSSIG